jgi:DHA2 family multidrug resistance protein
MSASAPASNPNKWWIAAAVSFGALMGAVDASIINVAIPHLRGVFSATTEEITWVSTVYLLAAAVAMPLAPWLSARWGRRAVCLGGLAVFTVASIACGLAGGLMSLVIARLVQGFAAGVLLPIEQVILRETFPPHQHGLAMGLYGITIMFGPALGPVLGGYLIDHFSWPWIFYINLPLGLIGYWMVSRFVHDPPDQARVRTPVDWAGIALLLIGMVALHVLLEQGERRNWFEAPINVALLHVAGGALLLFVAHELSTPKPIVDLRVLRRGAFVSALLISTVVSAVVYAALFLMPIYMQEVLGFSATVTGMTMLPRAAIMMVCFPLVGMFYNRLPPRILIAAGLLLCAASAWMMSKFDAFAGQHDIILAQLPQGVGLALILTPLSTMALSGLQKQEMGPYAGLYSLSRQLGGSLGIACFATLLSTLSTTNRASLVHAVVAGDALLRERLSDVTLFFYSLGGVDATLAGERALRRLEGRFLLEVQVLAIERAFQWSCLLFLLMIPLLFFLRPPAAANNAGSR